jgi:HD-GYP domain-containing protein (c-di-GMP phosphodiesterase class II)
LLTERPYKVAWTLEETLAYIEDERGRHFDPGLADIFLGLIRTGPPSFEAGLAAAPPARGRIASDGSPRPPAAGRRSP